MTYNEHNFNNLTDIIKEAEEDEFEIKDYRTEEIEEVSQLLDKHRPKSKEEETKNTTQKIQMMDETINDRVIAGPKRVESNKSQAKLINQVDEANPR